ncbi:MAG TPA: glycine oxidase ThiO [Ensifer sp.]|jgi:glycine oxidase|uniref:glycine oxidase ThiO n=1 Tax=Ensifer sp. TaxID=1872086 RepID=UPI002E10737A|nr:glycine oxidase ThiO [Ensifer sp.]
MHVLVKGAGVAGLTLAHELGTRGIDVTIAERGTDFRGTASWFAGGMLAPWCERESAEETVLTRGIGAIDWWDRALPGAVSRNGTLVIAPARDVGELKRFAARTTGYEWLDTEEIARLEPALAGRFQQALFFPGEAHLDPRRALASLRQKLVKRGVGFVDAAGVDDDAFDLIADCTGASSIGSVSGLRGVRGEMLYLQTDDVALSRPVRFIHPRIPLYIVPRGNGLFMCGATMIETDDGGPITARSLMELLNAAYALHPSFGEARLVETGTGIRPAFVDNLPRAVRAGNTITVNGLYRHGFLLSPALAQEAVNLVQGSDLKGDAACN